MGDATHWIPGLYLTVFIGQVCDAGLFHLNMCPIEVELGRQPAAVFKKQLRQLIELVVAKQALSHCAQAGQLRLSR